MSHRLLLSSLSCTALLALGSTASAQTFTSDVIIQGSACIGFDCTTSESFGFDTLRLKENNLRIKFEDTSTSASFPGNDWQLTANDSSNGGANRFSVDDVDSGRTPFTIEAGAPNNAVYIDTDSKVGFNTSNPAVDLHVVEGNSPTLRLEQDGSSGFTPQTWDISGNEANFFVRDVTGGSKLPLRIKPGAPDDTVFLAADGDVGVGTDSPSSALHVRRTDGTAALLIEETSGTASGRGMLTLKNNGGSFITMENTSGTDWFLTAENNAPQRFNIVSGTAGSATLGLFLSDDGSFQVGGDGTAGDGMALDAAGNMAIGGTLTQNSDKHSKMAIEPIDTAEILAKVAALEVTEWSYIADGDSGIRHIGPMAQDFYAAFGTGATDTGIGVTDSTGVALAAIQALVEENAELRARIERLEAAE